MNYPEVKININENTPENDLHWDEYHVIILLLRDVKSLAIEFDYNSVGFYNGHTRYMKEGDFLYVKISAYDLLKYNKKNKKNKYIKVFRYLDNPINWIDDSKPPAPHDEFNKFPIDSFKIVKDLSNIGNMNEKYIIGTKIENTKDLNIQ